MEEQFDRINGILTKLHNHDFHLTEKEIGCVKYLCRSDYTFRSFIGGGNIQPIERTRY